jgi:hypothetical protein
MAEQLFTGGREEKGDGTRGTEQLFTAQGRTGENRIGASENRGIGKRRDREVRQKRGGGLCLFLASC